MSAFTYEEAFSRNRGLLTDAEWELVRGTRVGIGGMGGCGSNHLMTLARMGFEKFAIADPDVFDLSNLNRQAGANLRTVGQKKVDVMRAMVLDVNPHADIIVYDKGIDETTMAEFIDATDIGINAIDFFRVDLYRSYHDGYRAKGKYSLVGASPFAFGAALTVMGPETPSFDEIFGLTAADGPEDMLRKFVATMAKSGFARSYLAPGVNEIKSPLRETTIWSTAAALNLCTALTSAEVLFTVTKRRKPTLAPQFLEFDMLAQAFAKH